MSVTAFNRKRREQAKNLADNELKHAEYLEAKKLEQVLAPEPEPEEAKGSTELTPEATIAEEKPLKKGRGK